MSDHPPIENDATRPDRRRLLTLGAGAAAGAGAIALATAAPAAAVINDGTYNSVTPLRLIDTRTSGGPISSGQTRTSTVLTGARFSCVCNLTVVNTTGNGYLALYNADLTTRPNYSSVNWQGAGRIVANLTIFDTGAAGFKIFCGGGSTNYILDFLGYFETASTAKTARQLEFESRAREAARRLESS